MSQRNSIVQVMLRAPAFMLRCCVPLAAKTSINAPQASVFRKVEMEEWGRIGGTWEPQGFPFDNMFCILAAVYTDDVSSDSTRITNAVNRQIEALVCVYCPVWWNMSRVTPRQVSVLSRLLNRKNYLYFNWFCIR